MRKDKIVCLATIRREMQERYRYGSREERNHAFEVLYHGWRWQGIRHGGYSQFYTVAWNRGWLSKKDADSLRKYIGKL